MVLLHACFRMAWLSEEACACLGFSAAVIFLAGCLVTIWWVGR